MNNSSVEEGNGEIAPYGIIKSINVDEKFDFKNFSNFILACELR